MARMTLEKLVDQLNQAHGDNLRSVVLYGSAATGQHVEKWSDLNVLVLLKYLTLEDLEREAEVTRTWVRAGNPPPLTLTQAEWTRCADVFPMEFADILERHRVLFGDPPFPETEVDRADLRLQAEREAMGKLIKLRQAILDAGTEPRAVVDVLDASLSTFMVIARALVRLHGGAPPADFEALSREAARLAGFDPEPFVRIVHHRRGDGRLSREEVRGILTGYLAGAERLFLHIDAMDPT